MNILFLCVANSARSQMAEGLAKNLLGHVANVQSAGSAPSKLNPLAIEVMDEVDIDIRQQYSKSVSDIDKTTIDMVITLCAEEVCPIFSGLVERHHWPLPDPSNSSLSPEEQKKAFRQVRDALKEKILALNETLQK